MTDRSTTNLFANLDTPESGERFETLLRLRNVKIERIVSSKTPEPTEYVQEQDEWVVLLQGAAALDIDGDRVELGRGDAVFLPAHTPHRVRETSAGAVWLAVHIR